MPGASFLLSDSQIAQLNATGHLNLTVPAGYDGLSFVTVNLSNGQRVTLTSTFYAQSTVNAQSGALGSNINALEPIKNAQGDIDPTILASPLVDGDLGATLIEVGAAVPTGPDFETIVTLTNDHNAQGISIPGASFILTNDQVKELNTTGHLNLVVPVGYDGLSFLTVDLNNGQGVPLERDATLLTVDNECSVGRTSANIRNAKSHRRRPPILSAPSQRGGP